MNDDDKTPAENPYAKIVQRIVREEFKAFEARAVEREERIAERLMQILGDCRAERDSDRLRIEALEQARDDHEARLKHIERVLRLAGADTEPPPEAS